CRVIATSVCCVSRERRRTLRAIDATARPLDSHSGSTLSRSKGRLSSPKSDAIDALRKSRYGRATLKTNVVVRGAGLLSPVGFEAVAEKCQRGFQGHLSGLGTIDVFAHLIAKGVRHAVVGPDFHLFSVLLGGLAQLLDFFGGHPLIGTGLMIK